MAEPLPVWAQKRHSDRVRENQSRSFALQYQEVYERILALESENKELRGIVTEVVGELAQDKTLSSRLAGLLKRKNP